MYKRIGMICVPTLALLMAGCYQARFERATTWTNYKVEMYSGSKLIRTWHTKGKVLSDSDDMTSYFVDRESGKIVELAGDYVITEE